MKKYSLEFKERMVLKSYGEKSNARLEKEFGLQSGRLSRWRKKYEKFGSVNFPADHFLRLRLQNNEIHELEKRIKHMDERFQILKDAGSYINKDMTMLLGFILKNEKAYSITLMCEVLNISRSFYQRWKKNVPTKTQMLKKERQEKIIGAFINSKQRYGAHRIAAALQNEGFQISLITVKRYMREMGLRCNIK